MTKVGRALWTEILSRDVAKAKAYYGTVFGWTFEGWPGMDTYFVAKLDGEAVAGLYQFSPEELAKGTTERTVTYFGVVDIKVSVATAEAAGGTVIVPVYDTPGVGLTAVVADPNGVPVAFWEVKDPA